MAILVPVLVGLFVALVSYWWIQLEKRRNKMKWLPEAPRVPLLGNVLELRDSTEILKVFMKYCEKYDGLFTIELITAKFIVASNPEFLEFLLGKMDILDKSYEYKFLSNWLGSGLLTADAEIWKKSRKMLTPSFHFSILENFIETFNSNADILKEILSEKADAETFDVFPYAAMSALDIISETTMGVSINAQRNPKSDYINAVKEKCRILIERIYSPIKKFDLTFPLTNDYYADLNHVKTLHDHTLKIINKRKQELKSNVKKETMVKNDEDEGIKKRKVFLDLMLDATIDGRQLSDNEIRQEVDTFMFAGHDTTATSLSFTLYCLSTHPEVQKRAVEEQQKIFGSDRNRSATHRDLQEMKYLEMIIKESLRMYPPVPYIGRKTKRDISYKDGNVILAGTGILVIIFAVNRNPKYFPEPDKFNPSRFEENKIYSQYAYIPFSAGPRNCIGQKFAMLEMKVVLSKVLRHFELLPSGQDLILSAQTVLKSQNGVNIKLKKRDIWN
ncbi:unnamed protein product [Psylliodes chrysocephalus]|uniref:Cytochrome P450 n=1 Tax=Psylliodes chrysocephalus TaxID=3402493 RepID=A0A9P0CYY6_9CUCU|nr:unnamed protein product [Psylliodes chrysocephala]